MSQRRTVTRTSAGLLVIASLLLTSGAAGSAFEVVFSGELRLVTAVAVSIRLADGRHILAQNTALRGALAPRTLAERYAVGDQVEITATTVGCGQFFLCLKKLRFLRKPSDQEMSRVLASLEWRQSDNLLRSPTPTQRVPAGSLLRNLQPPKANEDLATGPTTESGWLDMLRSRVLEFTSKLPNFVADEIDRRYVSTTNPPDWRLIDTIESEVTFKGSALAREHIVVDGKPWNSAYNAIPGHALVAMAGFGSTLPILFNPKYRTTFKSEGQVNEGGKSLSVVRFSSPPDSFSTVRIGYQNFFPGTTDESCLMNARRMLSVLS